MPRCLISTSRSSRHSASGSDHGSVSRPAAWSAGGVKTNRMAGPVTLRAELGGSHVGPADHDGHPLPGRGLVGADQQGRDPHRGGRFRGDPGRLPQRPLGRQGRGVADQHHVLDGCGLRDREHQLAHPPRGQGVGGDALGRRVGGPAPGPGPGRVGAPSGSTPITLAEPANQEAIPPISPPPPTGTSTVSRPPSSGLSACAVSSRPTVPWPSSVSRWWRSECTLIAPEVSTQACAAASASAYLSPVAASSAPSCRIRSILAGADTVGTKILAGTPLCLPPKPTLDAA